jgi:hypothetical protein
METKNRIKLVIVDSYLSERVPCAICGASILPVMGPNVFLADNLHGSGACEQYAEDKPTGMVCGKCVEKHEPDFNRLLQLGTQAGIFWKDPYFALVGGRKATVAPYGGRWESLWWWEGDEAPSLGEAEDEVVFDTAGAFFFPPKRWGSERVQKFAYSGEVPSQEQGWRRLEKVMPTI